MHRSRSQNSGWNSWVHRPCSAQGTHQQPPFQMDIPSLLAEADFSSDLGFHSGELHDARSNGYHAADSSLHDPCSGSGALGCSCCMAPQPPLSCW